MENVPIFINDNRTKKEERTKRHMPKDLEGPLMRTIKENPYAVVDESKIKLTTSIKENPFESNGALADSEIGVKAFKNVKRGKYSKEQTRGKGHDEAMAVEEAATIALKEKFTAMREQHPGYDAKIHDLKMFEDELQDIKAEIKTAHHRIDSLRFLQEEQSPNMSDAAKEQLASDLREAMDLEMNLQLERAMAERSIKDTQKELDQMVLQLNDPMAPIDETLN